MEVVFFDRKYTVGALKDEMTRLKNLALQEACRSAAFVPLVFVYTDDTQYVFNVIQFDDQKQAHAEIFAFARDKQAKFFVFVGMTSAPNKIASNYTDYFLHLVAHVDGKILTQKHTMMKSDGLFTILESTEDFSAMEKSEDVVEQVLACEKNDNAFDLEGVELSENPFS